MALLSTLFDKNDGHTQGKRGLKFTYSVNDPLTSTVNPTEPGETTQPGETTTSGESTTRPPTSPSGTNPAGYPTPPAYPERGSANFPQNDEIDESQCGTVFFDPVISDFDYVAQDLYVRNGTKTIREVGGFVVNGEEAVPYRLSLPL